MSTIERSIFDVAVGNASTPTFGILGGIAGHNFVKKLIKAGHKVIVWYENLEENNNYALNGIETAATPNEVIDKMDITFSFITDPLAAVERVFEIFLSDVLFDGKGFVQMGCLNVDTSLDIANTIATQNGRYLEVLILDSNISSGKGTVVIAAGEQTLYDDCRSFFRALEHKTRFVGIAGNAIKMYLVMQLISGVTQAALVEAMDLAVSAGIQKIDVEELLELSNWASPLLLARTNDIIWTDFATTNPIFSMLKDLILVLQLSETLGQTLPLTAIVKEKYKAQKQGRSNEHN